MKLKISFVLMAFCLCLLSCGDEGVLLDGLVPTAPLASLSDVGPVPEDVKKMLWGRDADTLMAAFKASIIEADANGRDIDIAGDIHHICLRREREAYYEKYISAGGVVIMGNGYIDDRFFYAARDIVLGMTQKRPELRAVLTPSLENRPGATQMDTRHDVTGRYTPGRLFHIVLVHGDMGYTSVPEFRLGNGTVQYHVAPDSVAFGPVLRGGMSVAMTI